MLFSLYPSLTWKALSIREFFQCKKGEQNQDEYNYKNFQIVCCGGTLIV